MRSSWIRGLVLLALMCVGHGAHAEAGVVTHLAGVLSVIKADGQRRLLGVKSEVSAGDELVSEGKTFARIRFTDGGNLVIRPDSRVRIAAYSYKADAPQDDVATVNLVKGGLRMVTGALAKRNPDRFETRAETATVGIRGTHFGLLACQGDCQGVSTQTQRQAPDGLHVDVLAGVVYVSNPAGVLDVAAGQFGFVPGSQQPPTQVAPEDGVRVAIPPSMVAANGGGLTIGLNSNDAMCVVR
jgi:hypothetical protein